MRRFLAAIALVLGLSAPAQAAVGDDRAAAAGASPTDAAPALRLAQLAEPQAGAGGDKVLWYKNPIEANLVIEGDGTVEDMATGTVYDLEPGTMYVLDKHDRHRIRTKTPMRLICVFTPPLVGGEMHDEDGAYPLF